MHACSSRVDGILGQAAVILQKWDREQFAVLDALPLPLYATDADGVITYFNPACIAFAGRTPSVNEDRWCVTWKLYTDDGKFIPHDQCLMAVALKDGVPVRGVAAIAERPDGTRLNFMPFPTPLRGENGAVTGAFNVFVDITAERQAEDLRAQAARCRRWIQSVNDPVTVERLTRLAAELDEKARQLAPE
jgi:PAS domain-containing protein